MKSKSTGEYDASDITVFCNVTGRALRKSLSEHKWSLLHRGLDSYDRLPLFLRYTTTTEELGSNYISFQGPADHTEALYLSSAQVSRLVRSNKLRMAFQ